MHNATRDESGSERKSPKKSNESETNLGFFNT